MKYLLDTNIFIQAKNLHYGLDFCPAFWDWLVLMNARGLVFSIDKVAAEIDARNDELTQWARGPGRRLFLPTDAVVAASLGKVSQWATSQRYEQAAINTFFQSADYYLVAHALARQCVVVTHEMPSISTKRIKIPNACMGLSIQFMTPYEMLRREQARFVLGNPGGSP
jgi:predicted nucleic acid-binding protein